MLPATTDSVMGSQIPMILSVYSLKLESKYLKKQTLSNTLQQRFKSYIYEYNTNTK